MNVSERYTFELNDQISTFRITVTAFTQSGK